MPPLPPFLSKGDKIAVAAPARKVSKDDLKPFIEMAENYEIEIVYSPRLFKTYHQFAGEDANRAEDFQYWLDNKEVKGIISARGGYGTARIFDQIDFSNFELHPKWLIGFSDFTVIHGYVNCRLKIPTLHAAMPAFLKPDSKPDVVNSFKSLFEVLKGNIPSYTLPGHPLDNPGNCKGNLIGGNLSVIVSIMGSRSELDTTGVILFLEDLDEYLYHIDRMMVCLKRAGKLNSIKGFIIGHMNDMHDSAIPFGKNVEEIIKEHTDGLGVPIYFNFDAGHMHLNQPLIFGSQVEIDNNCLTFGRSIQ